MFVPADLGLRLDWGVVLLPAGTLEAAGHCSLAVYDRGVKPRFSSDWIRRPA